MRVKCINNNNGGLALTIDRVYEVVETGDTCYTVQNDQGNNRPYRFNHFEVIQEANVVVQQPVVNNVVNEAAGYFAVINNDLTRTVFAPTIAELTTILTSRVNNGEFNDGDNIVVHRSTSAGAFLVRMTPVLVGNII